MAHDIWNLWPHDGYAYVDCSWINVNINPKLDLIIYSLLDPSTCWTFYKTIKCERKFWLLLLQGNPVVASPKEQLYEQMTSNPAFTERNIQKTNAYHLDSRPEQNFLVMHHTLLSLYVCVWLVNNLSSTAPIESPIIYIWSPADIFEQLMGNEFIFWFSRC